MGTEKVNSAYSQYIFKSRYARYLPEEKRREEWHETVNRYLIFFRDRYPDHDIDWDELFNSIYNMEVMPSMRALMTAGPALERDHVAGYNCAFVTVDEAKVFDEILYILMCGTGVGFSVERQYINKLPEVAEEFHDCETVIKVRDSKIGWASALRQLIALLYQGQVPTWNLEKLRPAGAMLKTFGGRSSGPEPLNQLFGYVVRVFKKAKGRKLNSLEVHDVVCKIAEVVVCGGVRRSALLSLSNLTDQRLRNAKQGEWYYAEPQRALSNNSVCYTERPDMGIFMQEWKSLYDSKAGERGIFNRAACIKMLPERRDPEHDFGTNPCSEIVLRPREFCNLTEVVLRPTDTQEDIRRKLRVATVLGTLQCTLTDFRYISKKWKQNCEEERLLGVSLTGIMDLEKANPSLLTASKLEEYRDYVVEQNKITAELLGVPASAATTCVKPSGTVSQLVDSSSGIHPRYAHYYIRRVRNDVNDPLCAALQGAGVPWEVANTNPNEVIFSFPIKSPDKSVVVDEISAIEQLEHWLKFAKHYCEHKPSVSVYVKEDEWMEVGAWVYKNWDYMNGVSFFPKDDHMYPQAPYEEITEEEYNKLVEQMPPFDVDLIIEEEVNDNTTGSQELACVGGACEL